MHLRLEQPLERRRKQRQLQQYKHQRLSKRTTPTKTASFAILQFIEKSLCIQIPVKRDGKEIY